MIQNHLLQVLCMVAMEPPVSFEADEIRNKKVEVLKAIRKWKSDEVARNAVRGQYGPNLTDDKPVPGYRQELGVSPVSMTETFAAVRLFCDNWRWRGVPFYIRTGKELARKTTQIVVQFKPAPHYAFPDSASAEWRANRLIISIAPDMAIRLQVQAKRPGQTLLIDPVEMVFAYQTSFGEQQPEAYETLLWDALTGDATLFMRADQVDAAWEVVMPILDNWSRNQQPDLMVTYAPGSWGPAEAETLAGQDGFTWEM
jgi:glucose-6-phosphate 1-dehydrogenase